MASVPVLTLLLNAIPFDAVFAGRHVDILDWADDRRRALLLVSSESDAGRYFIHEEGAPGRLREFFRRAPGMPAEAEGVATPFEFDTPADFASPRLHLRLLQCPFDGGPRFGGLIGRDLSQPPAQHHNH